MMLRRSDLSAATDELNGMANSSRESRTPALVVAHHLVNVRIDLRMKDNPHQLRRLSIRWSSSSNVMPRDGFASNSASRRRASARYDPWY